MLNPILVVFTLPRPQFEDFFVFLQRIPQRVQDILLNSFTITTATQRAKLLLLGLYP